MYKESTRVNNVHNDAPDLIEPAPEQPPPSENPPAQPAAAPRAGSVPYSMQPPGPQSRKQADDHRPIDEHHETEKRRKAGAGFEPAKNGFAIRPDGYARYQPIGTYAICCRRR